MKKILILSGIHVCHNPRVVKEADLLAGEGYEVVVLGMASLPHLREEDLELAKGRKWKLREVPGPISEGMKGKRGRYGLVKKAADLLAAVSGWQTEAQLGGWRKDLLREAWRIPADLTIAHSAPTLWVARELCRKGRAVAADFEDWFSQTHEKSCHHPHRVIKALEQEILQKGKYVTCTSRAIAEAMEKDYGKRPEVIYNSFPLEAAPAPASAPGPEGPKVIWISQALGPGRGLEMLMEALGLCEPIFTLTLVGNSQGDYRSELERKIPDRWRGKVFFQGQVKDRDVMRLISSHHVGLALEQNIPKNRDLTVTNKILQYLLGGLAVVATETQGQVEVAQDAPSAIRTIPLGKSKGLAESLREIAANPSALQKARVEARKVAEQRFCWEVEKKRLLLAFERSL